MSTSVHQGKLPDVVIRITMSGKLITSAQAENGIKSTNFNVADTEIN